MSEPGRLGRFWNIAQFSWAQLLTRLPLSVPVDGLSSSTIIACHAPLLGFFDARPRSLCLSSHGREAGQKCRVVSPQIGKH